MAKRKGGSSRAAGNKARRRTAARRSAKRPTAKARSAGKAGSRAKARKARARKRAAATSRPARPQARSASPAKTPRLNRARRTLNDDIVPTPPSSLNMDRHGSAARTGRAEYAENVREHHGMNEMSAGDADVNVEDAFFTGEEAPGGENPTPDQDVVDDIGKALGVEYADNEELKAVDKVGKRDKHRWELDPASSEDYKDRG